MLRSSPWVVLALCSACATVEPVVEPAPAAAAPAPAPAPKPPPPEATPELQLPGDTHPTHYTLKMTIDPAKTEFAGSAEIAITLDKARQVIWLHGKELKVSASAVKAGAETLKATYEQVNDDGVVKLTLPRAIGPGPATIQLSWTAGFDPRLLGLYLAHESGSDYAYTQFEDIFARRAFPGFDEPAFKTPYDVTLTVPQGLVTIANTPALKDEVKASAGMKSIHFAETKPLPTYLIAWAVGPFDVVEAGALPPNEIRNWPVPIRGVAPKGRGGELAYALKAGSELLLLEEKYFGIPYPYPKLDQVAVPDYAYGAMENAGEIHYREDLLLFIEGTTSEENRINIVQVMAHEQAHQWFGDLVTMRWWDEAWLNESFATWMGTLMTEAFAPPMHAMINLHKNVNGAMGNDALVTARAIRQPVTSVKNIPDQFDELTYQKGGAVLAMFERYVGAEPFRKGVSGYIAAHADGSGSTDDLLSAISKSVGRDVTAAFHTFLDQAGVPLIKAAVDCAAKPAVLKLSQSRYFPLGSDGKQDRTWQVPVCARYSIGGKITESCTLFTGPEGTLELPGCPAWLTPNAEGAGYYRWALAPEDLKKLRTAGYSQLSVLERIALAETLRVGVFSGTIAIADALDALEPIARDSEGEVAVEAMPLLRFARDRLLPEAEGARVDKYAIKLFAPVLKRLGFKAVKGESTSNRRLRTEVIGLLARSHDPSTVKEAVKLGRAYAGISEVNDGRAAAANPSHVIADGKFHPEAVDPDLAGLVLGIAVDEGDAAFFDALVARLATVDDGDLRGRILDALASAHDPKLAAKSLALSLDPKLRKQEGPTAVFHQSGDPRTRDGAWKWLQENLEPLAAQSPDMYTSFFPYVAGYCDATHEAEAKAFFEPRAEKYNGMPKNLRQALEQIHLCSAQADAQRASAMKFFGAKPAATAPAR